MIMLFYTWDSDSTRLEKLRRTAIEREARFRGALGRAGACSVQCQNVSIRYLYVHYNYIDFMYKVFIMMILI